MHSSPSISPQIRSLSVGHSTSFSSKIPFHLLTPLSGSIASASSVNLWSKCVEDVDSSSSTSNLIDEESICPLASNTQKGEDSQAANKSFVEKIRAFLEFGKDKYTVFK